MHLPFTAAQFHEVFAKYNAAVWPTQVGLLMLALGALWLVVRPRARSDAVISAILALLWLWLAVYHLAFFRRINPMAVAFAALAVAQGVALLWWGVHGYVRFERPGGWRGWAGGALLVYALAIYPVLSRHSGYAYPYIPTFGLPCPTTLYTVGLLAFLSRPYRWQLFIVPVLWSLIALPAAFLLSVPQDLGLAASAALGIALAIDARPKAVSRA